MSPGTFSFSRGHSHHRLHTPPRTNFRRLALKPRRNSLFSFLTFFATCFKTQAKTTFRFSQKFPPTHFVYVDIYTHKRRFLRAVGDHTYAVGDHSFVVIHHFSAPTPPRAITVSVGPLLVRIYMYVHMYMYMYM